MAGPGGGPPRKSHTKSRKGCKTCKRRHIRCDETFPQCRNCTKHNTRCDYMDSPPPTDEPSGSQGQGGLWNAAVEAEIDTWMTTGIFPFPELGLVHSHQFGALSKQELRLIHHVGNIYRDLSRRGLLSCTAWVEKLPLFLEASARHDFVMSAVLAFSAEHLALDSNSQEVSNMAYQHRGLALNGLHTAIGNFSEDNSDAILAASILLSWQASEWSGWLSLVQGTTTVLSSMEPWKDNSALAYFVETHCTFKAPTFMPPTFGSGGLMAPLLPDDDQSLQEAIHALRQLLAYLQNDAGLRQFVEEILRTAEEIDLCSRTTREDQLFEKLQFLRLRLLWAPITLLQQADQSSLNLLAIAHLYAVAMAVDASLPELNGAAFGTLISNAIEDIDRRIRFTSPQSFESQSPIDELMAFPRRMTAKNQQTRGSIHGSVGVPEPLMPGQQSPYGFGGLNLDSAPHTPNFPPTYPMFAGNISQEDLSVPPSPFLTSYVPHQNTDNRRHSALINHSRPNSISLDRRSFSALGYREDSPAFSPAGYGSPAHSYAGSDRGSVYGEGSPVPAWGQMAQPTNAGNFSFDESLDKGKGRSMG